MQGRGLTQKSKFSPQQMKELRYAALLHDFGKIAVREEVLVKANKLYPSQLTLLKQRFDYLRQQYESQRSQKKLDAVLTRGQEAASIEFARLDDEFRRKNAELDEHLRFILRVNESSVLADGDFDRLVVVARKVYRDPAGREHSLLTPEEVSSLSVPQGSLNNEERQQIEAHVAHTVNFLIQIPWTHELKYIPWIARAHHEKLNGSGYPYRLRGDEIPIQAKMMSICDVFDALSAADRPYKNAVPVDRALEILETSVRQNELDPELFRIFVEARVFQLTHVAMSIA